MSDEEKKEIAEEAGKRLIWDMLDASHELSNMSSYVKTILRKQENFCSSYKNAPSKDLRVKYNMRMDRGYTSYVWWLLEQLEKGNITIKSDVQSEQ